jgi:triacylglycerol lipase
MTRELPEDVTMAGLFHPKPDYPYFEHAADHPFEPDERAYDPVKLSWLADASLLTYVPGEDAVRERLERGGLRLSLFFEAGPRGFVADGDGFTILAFRGTDVKDIEDMLANADTRPGAFSGKGRVHQGFLAYVEKILPDLAEPLAAANGPVFATGHSLGAALATLTGALLEPVHAVVTFGSPRVGDRAFRDAYPRRVLRVVNNNDFVARIPPAGFFRHVGELVYIDRNGEFLLGTERWERVVDGIAGQIDRGGKAVDAVVDHSPLHYAIHAANAVET